MKKLFLLLAMAFLVFNWVFGQTATPTPKSKWRTKMEKMYHVRAISSRKVENSLLQLEGKPTMTPTVRRVK